MRLDHTRILKYDREAFSIIEKMIGVKDLNDLYGLDIDIKNIAILAWAGLAWADPELSIEQVRRMIEEKVGSDLKLLFYCIWIIKDAMSFYANKTMGSKRFGRE